ncbi:MAG: DUF1998 domain-containing protein [Candidatus Ozemobacteraceae bacterium]
MNELGTIRPSQLIFTFGVGALMDLPNISALIMGLDDWDTHLCREITEERLLRALQSRLGPEIKRLLLPPTVKDESEDAATTGRGVPVSPFPRWLRCPLCDTLATIDSGVFKIKIDRWRSDRTRFIHESCIKAKGREAPAALAVRFLTACRNGHLSDFPWVGYVHHDAPQPCKPARLTLREYGIAGEASDIIVKCLECNRSRRMGDAFDKDRSGQFKCKGHHPHLRLRDKKECSEPAKTILLGASNSWFPLSMSALSLPRGIDPLTQLLESNWALFKDIPSLEVLKYIANPSKMPQFSAYTAEELWTALEGLRQAKATAPTGGEPDLKQEEWNALNAPEMAKESDDFRVTKVEPPLGYEPYFDETVLVERVREVRALFGFTRIESTGDFTDADSIPDDRRTPLCRDAMGWVPASEVRGEGVFLRVKEKMLAAWEKRPDVKALEAAFNLANTHWRRLRKMEPVEHSFGGMRYVLLHSLAHALIRQFVLDCGYSGASLRERLYCRLPGEAGGPMAGILVYTAAPDSEGTLGGLVNLGQSVSMGRHIHQALEYMKICASDPLCSEHQPVPDGRTVHGAACHACMFVSETSCERGNRFLDRGTLVETFVPVIKPFFSASE